ncbi:unnamed protein product [Sordaria macrospora k-hell]|uniref:WGS project CABT00000000 data, contig 2.32 n=1 Tax=Sordaria macrospora (strain ATCC MYA-333 / DSM 997 / K(L3346) / K-hell) TaxID=771870 RepID=F7W5Y3_SORMK|nr:uncharacterized protein SMAC_06063 [Sordaria macrospora k-hell]CCC12921.1 unnamed protein product [Sordaria macrospora k-hell]
MRNVPMETPSHIMLQHDSHHLQYPPYQYPQSQQQHPQQLHQHHPHQQPQQQQAQQHQSPRQLHQHQQQRHAGGASSASEPDNDSDTFQALLTVAGTEAVGIGMGRSDHNERGHPDGRVGYYDPVQELGSGRPDIGREYDRGDQQAGSSGGGQVGGYGSLISARSGSGMEQGDSEAERHFGQDGRHGTGPGSLSGRDHQMDEDGMAVAAVDDEAIDQDLDMLIETSSGDEDDKGQNEYQNAAAERSSRYTPIMESVREQQLISSASASASANGDVEMATDSALGSRFTSINNSDGNGQQGSETYFFYKYMERHQQQQQQQHNNNNNNKHHQQQQQQQANNNNNNNKQQQQQQQHWTATSLDNNNNNNKIPNNNNNTKHNNNNNNNKLDCNLS